MCGALCTCDCVQAGTQDRYTVVLAGALRASQHYAPAQQGSVLGAYMHAGVCVVTSRYLDIMCALHCMHTYSRLAC
jgi:hypothetical protein